MSRPLKVRKPNAAEQAQLRQVLEDSTTRRICRWATALLFYGAGLNAVAIAAALAVHVNTIYTYLHTFAQYGVPYLERLRAPGAPQRISVAQVDEIVRIAERSPIEFGLPYGRWSLAKLRDYLIQQRRLVKAVSREHLRRILKKSISACGACNASSSVTIRSALPFWPVCVRLGESYPLRGGCSFLTSNRLRSKPTVAAAIARPSDWYSKNIKRRAGFSISLRCMM